MQIYQYKDGYCYNSDTLFLFDFAKNFLKKHYSVLEVGSGSGILGLLCQRDIPFKLTMIEKNAKMAQLCSQNIRINKSDATLIEADFLDFNFNSLGAQISYDCIISNPPFYNEGVIKSQNEILLNARYVENLPFFDFVKKVNSLLSPLGEFVFCYDSKAVSSVFNVLNNFKIPPICARFVYPKKNKSATLLLCRAKKNSKSMCEILPPLFVHENGDFSDEVQGIYKSANTWSIKC